MPRKSAGSISSALLPTTKTPTAACIRNLRRGVRGFFIGIATPMTGSWPFSTFLPMCLVKQAMAAVDRVPHLSAEPEYARNPFENALHLAYWGVHDGTRVLLQWSGYLFSSMEKRQRLGHIAKDAPDAAASFDSTLRSSSKYHSRRIHFECGFLIVYSSGMETR